MKTYLKSILAIIVILLFACEKDPTFRILSINDNATKVSNITTTSAEVIVSIFETESGDHYNYNHKTLEVYYSTSSNPFQGLAEYKYVYSAGTYTLQLKKLEPGTTYYYAAKLGNQRGKVRSFKTPPELTATTGNYSNLTAKSVQLEGSAVILNGGYLAKLGILVRLHNPDVTIDNYDHKEYSYFGKSSGTYTVTKSFSGLYTESTYYYRTYAESEKGKIYYGEVKSFKTTVAPTINVFTDYADNITSTSVRLHGNCTLLNGAQLAEAGVLLKRNDSNVSWTNYDKYGSGTYANFQVDFTNLSSNSTYYYRAYAKDKEGNVYYGEVKSFKTAVAPTINVFTGSAESITATSVKLSVNCTLNNGAQLAEAGILVKLQNSNVSLTNYDKHSSGTYTNFTTTFTNLSSNSTYYYRAYAKDKEGNVYYGEVKSFKTLTASISVTTGATENITYTSVRVRGYCTLNNGAQLAEAGILLKLQNSNVSLTNYDLYWYGTYTNFYVDFTDLSSNSTYYYRAYAKDKEGNVYYGEVKSFKTPMYKATLSEYLGTYSVKYDQGDDDFNEYDFPNPKDQTTCSSWNYNQTGTATISKITAPSGASGQWVKMTFTPQDDSPWTLSGKYDEDAYCICLYGDVAGDYTIPGLNASGAICPDCGVWAGMFYGHFTMPIYKSGSDIYLLSSGYGYKGSMEIRLVKSGPNAQIEFNAPNKDKKFGYYPNGIGHYNAWCGSPDSQGSFHWGTMALGSEEYVNLTFTKQ
ncbi:MAG: hypothetical protein KBS70_03300 [Bacteroidales bacterium]|nr:hypothetical protein [Candidatus Colicola equi]